MDLSPLWLSLRVALIATIFTFVLGILAAQLVVRMRFGKGLADGIFTLPLVLPPTVVGFFLLLAFGRYGALGQFLSRFGVSLVFSWVGAVVASTVVSFPLMYRTARGALEQLDTNLLDAGRTLGMTETAVFFRVSLPNSLPSIFAGTILAFARALGEFGATIMVAGNIPHRTQTASVAIYTAVQAGDWDLAYRWMFIIMALSITAMLLMNAWAGYTARRKKGA